MLLGLIPCMSGGIFIWLLVTEDRLLAQAFLLGTVVASIYVAYSNFAHAVVHGRPEGSA
ncbi:hypothetical protein [uncultured Nocardioides sp.]|uniref:hypothetical protein n=1 Tax=uncultured Nocardioides sp. TaxID=198441 RepID=UPI002603654B|nr:hypothetical protein [uncultured Nocardioides sp.]